jgi:hypothetical protein
MGWALPVSRIKIIKDVRISLKVRLKKTVSDIHLIR